MSVPPRRPLPERPSLEQLRKQAKEHLDTLRAADPSARLAEAQHALARAHGVTVWNSVPALMELAATRGQRQYIHYLAD